MADKGQGRVSLAYSSRVGSPVPSSTGLALLCYPDKVQGQLSRAVQLVSGSAPSPAEVSMGGCVWRESRMFLSGGKSSIEMRMAT